LELRWKDGVVVLNGKEFEKAAEDAFNRLVNESSVKVFCKFLEQDCDKFMREWDDVKFQEYYQQIVQEAWEKFCADKVPESPNEEEFAKMSTSLIKWGRETRESCLEKVWRTCQNFLDANLPEGKVVSTEKIVVGDVLDENMVPYPIQNKCIVDRVEIAADGDYDAVEYKTCESFSDEEAEKGDYEIQAAAEYFAVLADQGVAPRRVRFIEILKDAPDLFDPSEPEKTKFLKADLEAIAARNGIVIDKKAKVSEIESRLVAEGHLKYRPGAREVVIDFEKRPDVLMAFRALYAGTINMIALCEQSGIYLPNVSNRNGGDKSWSDFKEFEAMPREEAEAKVSAEKEKVIELPEDYQGF
jgi:RecB family exonuclease